ncbi:MAG TPA: hypothetical protein PK854_06970 [Oscillospiraceae bacterium]|nr:hypothetical protein [Oscillospiraceae bacterium]HPS34990.1 hypothetical protein [Oscillospiraceae bacterium]
MKTVDLETVIFEEKGLAALCQMFANHREELSQEEQDSITYMLSDLISEKADKLQNAFYGEK